MYKVGACIKKNLNLSEFYHHQIPLTAYWRHLTLTNFISRVTLIRLSCYHQSAGSIMTDDSLEDRGRSEMLHFDPMPLGSSMEGKSEGFF